MKQKGIILLITLFFISAISILILQNLDDSETFIKEVSYDTKLSQLNITNKNVHEQIIEIINDNKNYVEDILEKTQSIPLNFGNVKLVINLGLLEEKSCNINSIKKVEDIFIQCGEDITYNIADKYSFIENLNKIKVDGNTSKINTQQQLDYFINEYKFSVNDDQIDSVKDEFGFIFTDINSTYLKCSYDISVEDNINAKSYFIFKVGSSDILSSNFILE